MTGYPVVLSLLATLIAVHSLLEAVFMSLVMFEALPNQI